MVSLVVVRNLAMTMMVALLLVLVPSFEPTSARASGATWSAPVDLSDTGRNAFDPQVTVDELGNLTAVWSRFDGSDNIVQASRSTDRGVTWSTPVNLSQPGGDAINPQIAADRLGNLTAVWRRSNGAHFIVQSSRSADRGVTWSTPVNLSAAGGNASNAQVTVDGSGNLTAVWSRFDGSRTITQASSSSDGGVTWSTPANLSAAGQNAFWPQVTVDELGNRIAVWYRLDVGFIVQASRSTDGGVTWSTPVNLSAAGSNAYDPQVTVDGSGNFIAVWYREEGMHNIVQSSRSTDRGVTWSTPVNLSQAGGDAINPQIAADRLGNLTAVWYRREAHFIVQASSSSDGGMTWSTPVNLSAAGGNAFNAQVTVDGSGNLTAVWRRSNGAHFIVQSSRSADRGVTWSTPVDLSAAGQDANGPQVTVDGVGNSTAVWLRSNGAHNIVQSANYRLTSTLVTSPGGDSGVPGIFLAVNRVLVGTQVAGAPVYFGADRVAATSTYQLTVTPVSKNTSSVMTLAEGTIGVDGSFSSMVRLPTLAPGTYNISMTGQHINGATLELTAQVTVDAGVLSSVGANIPVIR